MNYFSLLDINKNKFLLIASGEARHVASTYPLGNMLKEPTHIQAHLVFADTQSPNKKPKELEFCQRSTTKYRD